MVAGQAWVDDTHGIAQATGYSDIFQGNHRQDWAHTSDVWSVNDRYVYLQYSANLSYVTQLTTHYEI